MDVPIKRDDFVQFAMLNNQRVQGGAPPVISWFIIPLTIDISTISPSYWSRSNLYPTNGMVNPHKVHPNNIVYEPTHDAWSDALSECHQ